MSNPFELGKPFLREGDRVLLHKNDGDGHIITKECGGVVTHVLDRENIGVEWDDDKHDDKHDYYHEDDLVLEA